MGQPGKVADPARGQLNRENEHSPVILLAVVGKIPCFKSRIKFYTWDLVGFPIL